MTSPADFSVVTEDPNISYAKTTEPITYPGDVTYKEEYLSLTTKTDCQHPDLSKYASCTANTDVLHYDVYYPSSYTKNQYISCPLPAVIFVLSGGFSDCKPINENVFSPEGNAFAQRGFVWFNVEYRNGVRLVPSDFGAFDPNGNPYISVQQQLAEYRASQDVRGAIRSIIQRQLDQNALTTNSQKGKYQIDLSNIFLAANSAGSITILNAAYYPTQMMVNQINPYAGTLRIEDVLGKINADYYYGDMSIPISSNIKGILAQWGSFTLPPGYTPATASTFFDPQIKIPIICFHGLQDKAVYPFNVGVYFAPNDPNPNRYKDSFNTERACLINSPFKSLISMSSPPTPPPAIYTYGSPAYVQYILQPLGIKYELYLDCDAGHGLRNAGTVFKADYGTGYTNMDDVTLYIIGRAATFFQGIIGNTVQTATSHTTFVECANYRVTCDTTHNDAGCLNNDNCSTHPH